MKVTKRSWVRSQALPKKSKPKPRNEIERPAVGSTVVEHSTTNPKIEGSNPVATRLQGSISSTFLAKIASKLRKTLELCAQKIFEAFLGHMATSEKHLCCHSHEKAA
jgi:hypothetical protein